MNRERGKRLLLSGFILFHLLATVAWNLPDSAIRSRARDRIDPYVMGLGLWQMWGVFSPEEFHPYHAPANPRT